MPSLSRVRVVVLSAFALVLGCGAAACGGASTEPKTETDVSPSPSMTPSSVPSSTVDPISSIPRSKVKQAIGQGLGVLLQNVSVEDWPVMREGKFHGFKVRALNPAWGVDLKAGDVVTRINGMPIEHPEDADAVLRSLEKAPALRVDFEREGKARVLDLPIVDDMQDSTKAATGAPGGSAAIASSRTALPAPPAASTKPATTKP